VRWFGLFLAVVGAFAYLLCLTYQSTVESQTKLVQVVKGEELIGRPQKVLLGENAKIVKGTGPDESIFVDHESKYVPFSQLQSVYGLAKVGAIAVCILGCVGYGFETWRKRTSEILRGIDPEKLRDFS
jgi:hypothetical protein